MIAVGAEPASVSSQSVRAPSTGRLLCISEKTFGRWGAELISVVSSVSRQSVVVSLVVSLGVSSRLSC
jgi:hypothetical protein